MKATPHNMMTLVGMYTGLRNSSAVVTHGKIEFTFYPQDTLDLEDEIGDSVGFNMTPELLEDLESIMPFARAAAAHIQHELTRPIEIRRRVFMVGSDMKYIIPKDGS